MALTFSMVPVMGATAPPWAPEPLTAARYFGTGTDTAALPSYSSVRGGQNEDTSLEYGAVEDGVEDGVGPTMENRWTVLSTMTSLGRDSTPLTEQWRNEAPPSDSTSPVTWYTSSPI